VRCHTLVNGLSKAGAGAESGYRTNNLWLGYGPHLTHRPPILKTYKALQRTWIGRELLSLAFRPRR